MYSKLDEMFRQKGSILVPNLCRQLSNTSQLCASHYDVLGITPRATQNDIKTAYYKLSKIYHPDISKDESSAKKFRALTEAYEVLGNIKLKKMYDKGLLTGTENTSRMEYNPEPEPTDPTLKFYKSHKHRQVMPTMDGKVPIYDFDTWSKQHYGDMLRKSQYDKEFIRKKQQMRINQGESVKTETIMFLTVFFGCLFFSMALKGKSNYDVDELTKKKE